jgi:hypothetical protein
VHVVIEEGMAIIPRSMAILYRAKPDFSAAIAQPSSRASRQRRARRTWGDVLLCKLERIVDVYFQIPNGFLIRVT